MVTAICIFLLCGVLFHGVASEYHHIYIPKNSSVTLPTDCSEFTDCSSCNDKVECNFLNSQCEERNIFGIQYHPYNVSFDYPFCSSATDRGDIILSYQLDETLTLGHKKDSNLDLHSLCEWIK